MRVILFLTVILVISVTGCVTTKTQTRDMQVQRFQAQVSKLQDELEQKNEKIDYLEHRLHEALSRRPVIQEEKKAKDDGLITPKDIQTALKNAGFYKGAIDNKIGPETKKALKDFQKAKGLVVDGVAGKETCFKLKKYLK